MAKRLSALPPKADILFGDEKSPLSANSGLKNFAPDTNEPSLEGDGSQSQS